MLSLAPADAADLIVGNERRVGPDAVLVEAAPDPPAERRQIGVVHEHHDLAERVLAQGDELVDDHKPEHHADGQRHSVIRRLRTRPRQQRAVAAVAEPKVFEHQPRVGDEESDAEQQQHGGQKRLHHERLVQRATAEDAEVR